MVREVRDQRYVPGGGAAQCLDLLIPEEDAARPVVVFIHGGAWRSGSRTQFDDADGPGFVALRDVLVAQGWATVSVDYRLTSEAQMPAQLDDVAAAVRWVRSSAGEFGLDAERIAVVGESAGGHLAQLLGTTGEGGAVRAVVSYYGVSDLAGLVADRVATGCGRGEAGRRSPEGLLIGADPAAPAAADVAAQASPLTHVSSSSAPTLFLHGLQDCVVPHLQSERAHAAMQAAGAESELVLVDGGHAEPHFFSSPDLQQSAIIFLARHLDT